MSEGFVRRHPTRGPGFAEVRLPGAGSAAGSPGLRIYWEANHDPYLGPRGWQPGEATLTPDEAVADGDDLVLTHGPDVCEHLESDTYELILPGLGGERYVVPWIEIPRRPSRGRETLFGRTTAGAAPLPKTAEPPTIVEPVAPVSLPSCDGEAKPAPKSRQPILLGVLLALIVVGTSAWWLWPASKQSRDAGVAASCHGDGRTPIAQQTAREIANRAGCGAEEYPAAARALQEAGKYDDALLLLEVASDKGIAPAMVALGRLYDPTGFVPGKPFSEPKPMQAAKLYQAAAKAGDASVAVPRAALKAYLQQKADGGDTLARLSLEDYWP